MSDLKSEPADAAVLWWPDIPIVAEARPGVIANLAILAEHSAAVRAALAAHEPDA